MLGGPAMFDPEGKNASQPRTKLVVAGILAELQIGRLLKRNQLASLQSLLQCRRRHAIIRSAPCRVFKETPYACDIGLLDCLNDCVAECGVVGERRWTQKQETDACAYGGDNRLRVHWYGFEHMSEMARLFLGRTSRISDRANHPRLYED